MCDPVKYNLLKSLRVTGSCCVVRDVLCPVAVAVAAAAVLAAAADVTVTSVKRQRGGCSCNRESVLTSLATAAASPVSNSSLLLFCCCANTGRQVSVRRIARTCRFVLSFFTLTAKFFVTQSPPTHPAASTCMIRPLTIELR